MTWRTASKAGRSWFAGVSLGATCRPPLSLEISEIVVCPGETALFFLERRQLSVNYTGSDPSPSRLCLALGAIALEVKSHTNILLVENES